MSRLFVRHAQSYANQTGVLAPEFLGSNLSPLGHQQAESSASYIRGIVPECIKITSSPHVRCMQTAQHIAANLGVEEIKIDDTLGVRFLGDALGRDGAYRRGYSTYDEIPNSESTRDFLQRIFPYTLENDNGYGQEANAAEIIVTHSGVISALRYLIANRVPFEEIPMLGYDCYRADYNKYKVPNASIWEHSGDEIDMVYPEEVA